MKRDLRTAVDSGLTCGTAKPKAVNQHALACTGLNVSDQRLEIASSAVTAEAWTALGQMNGLHSRYSSEGIGLTSNESLKIPSQDAQLEAEACVNSWLQLERSLIGYTLGYLGRGCLSYATLVTALMLSPIRQNQELNVADVVSKLHTGLMNASFCCLQPDESIGDRHQRRNIAGVLIRLHP